MDRVLFSEKDLESNSYLKEGVHDVFVKELSTEPSKSGNPMLTVTMSDVLGAEAREYFPLSDNAKWKLAQFAVACGIPKETLHRDGLAFGQLKGRKLTLVKKVVGKEVYDGKERNKYELSYGPARESGTQASGSFTEDLPF